jgi:hypothetical protein
VTKDAEAGAPDTTGDDGEPDKIALSPEHDWFLAQLVGWANEFGIEQGITLAVGGAVISGQLISGKRFFEELATFVMSSGGNATDELKKALAESIKQWTVIYNQPEGTADDSAPPVPTYIHLRNALWIYPDGRFLPANHGVLWRGKLAAIDGFCLGETRPASQQAMRSA